MACVPIPQCNFLYEYFQCQLPEDIMDVEITVRTMKEIHKFKRDHANQVISCRSWSSQLHPYQSLARKMRTYLELKDQEADPPHPNLTYLDRPNTSSPQKLQSYRNRMAKESKKRNRSQQAGSRQYKLMLIEKPLVLSRALAVSVVILPPVDGGAVPPQYPTPPYNIIFKWHHLWQVDILFLMWFYTLF